MSIVAKLSPRPMTAHIDHRVAVVAFSVRAGTFSRNFATHAVAYVQTEAVLY